jgi:hypothetical protein
VNARARRKVILDRGSVCGWCAISVSIGADVVERPAGPLVLCRTCTGRYRDRDVHPYLHRCLERQGR